MSLSCQNSQTIIIKLDSNETVKTIETVYHNKIVQCPCYDFVLLVWYFKVQNLNALFKQLWASGAT